MVGFVMLLENGNYFHCKIKQVRGGKRPHRHEDLSSFFRTHMKMPGMVASIHNSTAGKAETGGFLGLSSASLV